MRLIGAKLDVIKVDDDGAGEGEWSCTCRLLSLKKPIVYGGNSGASVC